MYKCEIIADSLSPQGNRLTTFKLTYPRIIHSELMTHRVFSRNSASSRAIPFNKMVKMVEEDPFIPIAWQKDHKGMQGSEYATYPDTEDFKSIWLEARDNAIKSAQLAQTGKVKLTKQLCNRLLEPFMWHTVLVTGTEFENFFSLRCPKYTFGKLRVWRSRKDAIIDFPDWESRNDLFWLSINKSQAEIHIQKIAEMMWDTYNSSVPKTLEPGQWHIPFGDKFDWDELTKVVDQSNKSLIETPIKIAVARCARLSYMTFDGEIDYEKDIKLHDHLLESKHFSPFEHIAKCPKSSTLETYISETENGITHCDKDLNLWSGNFKGWIQYRQLVQ